MADDLQKVLGDYHDNTGLAQAAKEYLESLGESAVAEAPAANRDDLEKAYMLAVRHHEGSGDDEGTGDGNYSEDVGDLLMDYYEKTGKKPDHEQIERISNKINADEEHYADILNAESINGKIWLELAKKHYGVMMKIKEPITYPESAVAEAPSTDINKSTMPSELDRIRELSGLQQEAAVSLKGKESALKAWYNKYSKYTGGNGDPLPFGLIKAYTESGIISDGYEENELAKAEKALGKKEGDWEDQDWQKVYSMTPITQGMEKDLLTATGSKTVDEELLAKVYDVIEDMYPSYDQVLGKKESAVAEAPASGDQALAKDLANHFMKKANSFKSRGDTGPEYEEMVDIAKAFQQGQDQGMEEINDLANFEFSAHPFGGKFSNNEGEPEDEVLAILNKHGYSFTEKSHPERPNRGLVTLIKKDANTSKISQLAAQPVNSSVDDTIQRARAQIETLESALKEDYKKFQGMKPYKPKKK